MLSTAAKQTPISTETGDAPDDLLGAIIYASKAWNLLEHSSTPQAGRHDKALAGFENFERFSESGLDEERITLADDLAGILSGEVKEFHQKYYLRSLTERRPFSMHAARLNLPPSTVRVLITYEELSAVQEDFR